MGLFAEYKEVPPPGGITIYILEEEFDVALWQFEQPLEVAIAP